MSAPTRALIFIKFVLLQYPKINNLISKIEKNTQEHVADSNSRSIYYWDMYILQSWYCFAVGMHAQCYFSSQQARSISLSCHFCEWQCYSYVKTCRCLLSCHSYLSHVETHTKESLSSCEKISNEDQTDSSSHTTQQINLSNYCCNICTKSFYSKPCIITCTIF